MRIAVIYEEREVFVAFDTETFISLLEKYYKEYGSIRKAMERVEFDLKQKTRYK